MEIIDITKKNKKRLYPIGMYQGKVICKEISPYPMFEDSPREALSFWEYNTTNKALKRISSNEQRIYYYEFYDKNVNEEDAIYYLIEHKQVHFNTFTLFRIDLSTGVEEKLYSFDVYEKFDVQIIPLTKKCFIAFYKEQVYDFEIKIPLTKRALNHDEAYLFDIEENKKYRIYNKDLIYGFKYVLFQARVKNIMHLIFEEVYLDMWEKKDIFVHSKGYRKNNRIFNDSIRIIPLDDFIKQIKQGNKMLSFNIIDSRGYDGIAAYQGITDEEIFYYIEDFNKDTEKLISIDRKNMNKQEYSLEYLKDKKALYDSIIYNLESEDKRILHQTFYEDRVYNKELVYGDKEFTYDFSLGRASQFIEGRYLITHCIKGKNHKKYTHIIDVDNNTHKKYLGEAKVFNDKIILF